MGKKGFTLVEVLAVIVILGVLATIVIPSVFTMMRKAKDNAYNILIDSFEENARLYATRHREEVENSLDLINYYTLTLSDLNDDDLIKLPITDPRNEETISLTKKIYITRDTDNSLSVCYEDKGCYVPILLANKLTEEGNVVTGSTEGLHYDLTNDIYYYRGGNPNNWLDFNGYLWRIVKINTDGTIKIIYEGVQNASSTIQNGKVVSGQFSSTNVNNYEGSTINSYLQSWYDANITTNSKSKVQALKWCVGKITYNTTGTPKSDFFDNECGTQTTGNLSIGLISGSEYLYASLDSACLTAYKTTGDFGLTCKNSNYLYKSAYNYWSITCDTTSTDVWPITVGGSLGSPIASNTTSQIRPVINLIASVIIDRGTGTYDSPYKIKDIVNVDKEKPTITVLGSSLIELEPGASYIDDGATATDNIDGDLTSKIITTSNVNINVPGAYNVTYTVSDKSGNKRSGSRTVKVIAHNIANAPVSVTGMIPVYYDEVSGTWKKANALNPSNQWYDYDNQKWANAVTVTTGTRETNQSKGVGETIDIADINAMFVWIPRYKYRILAGTGAREILVSFESKNNPKSTGDAVSLYYTHPAFTFGGTELSGIWVGKFETTGDITAPTILPDVQSLKSQTVKDMYDSVKTYMQGNATFGFTNDNDIHMMKNTEWGAVAYLSGSKYGKYSNVNFDSNNKELYKNNSSSFITGRSMGAAGGVGKTTTLADGTNLREYAPNGYYTYDGKCASIYAGLAEPCDDGTIGEPLTDKTLAYGASTTGSIYGIYDMSGGALDYVMGVYEPDPIPATGIIDLSEYSSATTNSQYDLLPNSKYYDRYLTDSANTGVILGDATKETSGWYGDCADFVNSGVPWFIRGGFYYDGEGAGAWGFDNTSGGASGDFSFRVVLSPQA